MDKKIIIYGAGKYGKKIYYLLERLGIKIDFFCETEIGKNKTYQGVPIISIEQLALIESEKHIFIAIANRKTSRDIKALLENKNIKDINVYECNCFLEANWLNVPKNEIGKKHCLICRNNIEKFEAAGIKDEFFSKHSIIGGGYREGVLCPQCGTGDRNRWLFWVLKNNTQIFEEKCTVLHIAPEKDISQLIQKNSDCDYYAGDIEPGRAMHIVDITSIQFKDEFFDYIIINHVLEHVQDEEVAMKELKRVLKKRGNLILSVPICMEMDTYENVNVITKEERLREFGQEDHVRLYGKDYKERFSKYGLDINVLSPKDVLSDEDIQKYGFIENDIIMVCSKDFN